MLLIMKNVLVISKSLQLTKVYVVPISTMA